MTDTRDDTAGVDRRSLIKKGLVLGGAAAVLPIVTTFDAPAFAASAKSFRLHFNVTLSLNALNVLALTLAVRDASPPTTSSCATLNPAYSAAAPDPGAGTIPVDVAATSSGLVGTIAYTITSGACIWTAGVHGGNATSCANAFSPTGVGTQTVSFQFSLLSLELIQNYFLIATCP